MNQETSVINRYGNAAKKHEENLCCPVEYDTKYLKLIPDEIIEKDYGCGDPLGKIKEGDTVLDLGSGGGKVPYIVSQIVGETGKVIGVDMNDDMLNLAKKYQNQMIERIGYDNIIFHKGKIQNLKLNLEELDKYIQEHPASNLDTYQSINQYINYLENEMTMIKDNSIDVVISNCVLNLVSTDEKEALFKEIYRVLKNGGKAVISDIVSNVEVPEKLRQDENLWSGCYSGAIQEKSFVESFEDVGFYGVEIDKREETWTTIEDIDFRSMTVIAHKGKEGPCIDKGQSVIYKGPFKHIEDDDDHIFERGERTFVCEKTFNILKQAPYKEVFEFIDENENLINKSECCDTLCGC
ncbi:methyltransferase [Staphylococcus haemolyticus]|uniref:methyltransferase domain-containing protein n=1 Tax=Staphylococcus TaxID=1279 RepID=UPI000CAD5805|nr:MULTISPECIES: methyltransferase domain-containing protein [Staphylococcus]PNH22640.1 methyltransferase [Staphylococcus haemolyticus]MCI2760824.1 methyltransferase domain-containing protein [Staphylococcus lugdunensis]MCI2794970.1 methyltransferase domain-containing protein [Staphylococcus lugdunensis]MCI2797429.1 methyltransferase domain-containing protein [Staphylococcus lugdunensis]MCJ1657315.1 methyltransferase domain-containing protein [Staphylococcus sp. NRL 21/187]